MKKVFFCALLLTCMSCANRASLFMNLNAKSFSATQAENIELYFAPEKPPKTYEIIGYVTVGINAIQRNNVVALATMKEKAAKNGADAVLNITFSLDDYGLNAHLTGLAVKWK